MDSLPEWMAPQRSPNFLGATKMVFSKNMKSRNSGSEWKHRSKHGLPPRQKKGPKRMRALWPCLSLELVPSCVWFSMVLFLCLGGAPANGRSAIRPTHMFTIQQSQPRDGTLAKIRVCPYRDQHGGFHVDLFRAVIDSL